MLRLFLPEICIHCNNACDYDKQSALTTYLCKVCLRQFELFEAPRKEDLILHSSLFRELPVDVNISSGFSFQNGGIIQSVIHHAKYQDMPKLAIHIGKFSTTKNTFAGYDFLLPIPLHRTRYSERGYNQSEMISKGISAENKIPIAKRNWLKRIRQTPTQTGLTLEQREENVRGAFKLSAKGKEALQDKRILIVDDVMTTGATLASAAAALLIAKPKKVDLFALAAVVEM